MKKTIYLFSNRRQEIIIDLLEECDYDLFSSNKSSIVKEKVDRMVHNQLSYFTIRVSLPEGKKGFPDKPGNEAPVSGRRNLRSWRTKGFSEE
jgi:hypothetical protein